MTCTDPDDDSFTFALGNKPAHGTATADSYGSFEYSPAPAFVGTDAFSVAVTDTRGAKATVQIAVQVVGPDQKVVIGGGPVSGVPGSGGGKNPTPAAKLSAIGKASKSKKGKFTVKLTCSPGAGSCAGKLVIKSTGKKPKTVASASYSLTPGSSKSIKLKLNKTGRKLQRKGHKKLKAKATAATLKTTFTIKGN